VETTKLKLAIRLQEVSEELAKRCEKGEFSDYESEHATPKVQLVHELNKIYKDSTNLKRSQLAYKIAGEVMDGKFDETREEAEAWFEREGKDLL
jgi:predicted nucleic acid-binding protein